MSKTIDQCDIFFVDHGDTEWVPVYLVQHIHPSLLEVMKAHHMLTDLRLDNRRGWVRVGFSSVLALWVIY